MTAVQQWKSRVHRWHQLSRYYLNKWHYDGSKWAERVWYGTGSQTPNSVASVPFMITRNMRTQLEQMGFPGAEISSLLPKTAHELINQKTTYAQYVKMQQMAAKNEEIAQEVDTTEVKEIVAAIVAREEDEAAKNQATESTSSLALVPETQEEQAKTY
ncbi:hypothetical protein Poli38472_007974 [Pythium oligandrum]|uniref:Uncharacterized protein n=1 Tax=Pythium oligandrum TaxID=41045 RepID=A0A8K1CKV0_PYTOL|nr:hypothetical protein Poli38472_007974 [Pythium oligandrum]|eukprot:TMW65332.1 hypothetical protein Poli38472_007974 [Pythium oligandrum]